jgi:hypothetical protein
LSRDDIVRIDSIITAVAGSDGTHLTRPELFYNNGVSFTSFHDEFGFSVAVNTSIKGTHWLNVECEGEKKWIGCNQDNNKEFWYSDEGKQVWLQCMMIQNPRLLILVLGHYGPVFVIDQEKGDSIISASGRCGHAVASLGKNKNWAFNYYNNIFDICKMIEYYFSIRPRSSSNKAIYSLYTIPLGRIHKWLKEEFGITRGLGCLSTNNDISNYYDELLCSRQHKIQVLLTEGGYDVNDIHECYIGRGSNGTHDGFKSLTCTSTDSYCHLVHVIDTHYVGYNQTCVECLYYDFKRPGTIMKNAPTPRTDQDINDHKNTKFKNIDITKKLSLSMYELNADLDEPNQFIYPYGNVKSYKQQHNVSDTE